MIIKEIQAKNIITVSKLPGSDYVINPYTGCAHGCLYCYARFMKRFSGHVEAWGSFVDAKINAPDLIPEKAEKYAGKAITLGSVTDPYQTCEAEYEITRRTLAKLLNFDTDFTIITKSALVARDIDLLKRFKDMTVAVSLAFADNDIIDKLEPGAAGLAERIRTVKTLRENNIRTVVFISPIFPVLSDWREVIRQTRAFAPEYWFENLNIYPSVRLNIRNYFRKYHPSLVVRYREIYHDLDGYWNRVADDITRFCGQAGLEHRIFFHHNDIRKK